MRRLALTLTLVAAFTAITLAPASAHTEEEQLRWLLRWGNKP